MTNNHTNIFTNDSYSSTINVIIKVFAILDILATLIVGGVALFAPGLKVFIFQKEPTVVILIIFIIILLW